MKNLISLIILTLLLIGSIGLNVCYILDEDKEEYVVARVQKGDPKVSEASMKRFLQEKLKINPKEVALVIEIIHQIDIEVEGFVAPRALAYSKKYGIERHSYIYQAEDYVFLGEARIRAKKRMIDLMGEKKWNEFYDYIQNYNQGKFSSHPIDPILFN